MAKAFVMQMQQIVKESKLQTREGAFWNQGLAIITPEYFYFQAKGDPGCYSLDFWEGC